MLADIIWDEKTLAVGGAFAVPIVAICATYWFKLGKSRSDNQLKRDMIARGMSVDEIERIIAAGGTEKDS
jgi:hypothetical protein